MDSMLNVLMSQLGGNALGPLTQAIGGSDQNQTQNALGAALPAIIGALANNAQRPGGADAIASALGKHDGSILDQVGGGSFGGIDMADGAKILSHVLGNRQSQVASNVAGQSGLDMGMVMKLLPILAPIVMGMLGKQQRQNQLDSGGLTNILKNERQVAEKQNPGLGGLAGILDMDGDGDVDAMDAIQGATKSGGLMGALKKIIG